MSRHVRVPLLGTFALGVALSQAACASAGRIADYDFRDRTVGVVAVIPPRPYVDTGGDVDLTGTSALGALVKLGTSVYKKTQAAGLRARLDSASAGMDLADRIAGGVLERSARYLGALPSESSRDADFQIEIRVQEYGIDAHEWEAGARFRIKAQLLLLDRDGREVWEGKVDEDEPVTDGWFRAGSAGADIVTGRVLGDLSVNELVEAMNAIADHTGVRLTEKLRRGIEKARGDE